LENRNGHSAVLSKYYNYLNLDYHENDSIEFEEQQIALREKKLQKKLLLEKLLLKPEAEALELANLVKKKELGL
jgi:hypothetical protein